MNVQAQKAETSSSVSLSRFLMVAIGGRYLAFDAEAVQGVLTTDEAGHTADLVAHGVVYRAVDLVARLNLSDGQNTVDTRVVLLAERGVRGSIRVTKVQGLLDIPQSQVLSLPAQFCGPERRWYRGLILFDKSVALVLNSTWVLEQEEISLEMGNEQEGPGRADRGEAAREISMIRSQAC